MPFALRAELHRLFQWLKAKGVTTIVTGERAGEGLTRHGLEEYLTDCVIVLDQRVTRQEATRRLRILKYRGSSHSNNEFPFMIDENGLSVLPITSMGLAHEASTERISTGVPRPGWHVRERWLLPRKQPADLGHGGHRQEQSGRAFRRRRVSLGAQRCLYLALEESPQHIVRNMRSIGLNLESCVRRGVLRIDAQRPTAYGLEAHLLGVHRLIEEWNPDFVVIDPVSNLVTIGSELEVKLMLARLFDFMKSRGITAWVTSLTQAGGPAEQTDIGVSSLMDVWLLLGNIESNGERNRTIQIVKARGTAHSNQIREFRLSDQGMSLVGLYRSASGRSLIGAGREAEEAAAGASAPVPGLPPRP